MLSVIICSIKTLRTEIEARSIEVLKVVIVACSTGVLKASMLGLVL